MPFDLELPVRGLAAGLMIAAPVGPVNLLCIRRTLEKGWKSGIVSGLGAALADTLYGAIAGFSISLVIQPLIREQFWIRIIGGILLMGIGVAYYCKPPRPLEAGEDNSPTNSDSRFLLSWPPSAWEDSDCRGRLRSWWPAYFAGR